MDGTEGHHITESARAGSYYSVSRYRSFDMVAVHISLSNFGCQSSLYQCTVAFCSFLTFFELYLIVFWSDTRSPCFVRSVGDKVYAAPFVASSVLVLDTATDAVYATPRSQRQFCTIGGGRRVADSFAAKIRT